MRCKVGLAVLVPLCGHVVLAAELHLNERDYFETQGLSVLAYQNTFHPVFRDQKLGGIERPKGGSDRGSILARTAPTALSAARPPANARLARGSNAAGPAARSIENAEPPRT